VLLIKWYYHLVFTFSRQKFITNFSSVCIVWEICGRCTNLRRTHDPPNIGLVRLSNIQQQNLPMPLAPGGVSPLHRTGNALKVFCVTAVGKTCTLLTNLL